VGGNIAGAMLKNLNQVALEVQVTDLQAQQFAGLHSSRMPWGRASIGRSITQQRDQAIGKCATPAEIVVPPIELLKMHLIPLGTQHVP
jgi:hypothetical protein